MDWPYSKPVFVLSNSITSLAKEFDGRAEILKGSLQAILGQIHHKGFERLYIDGGKTVQNFLKEDLIDEMTITTIPILLGGGSPLFGELPKELEFEHVKSVLRLDALVQDTYRRNRD